ncbi:IPT/TIG domain-containing protein [Jatrophihabitans endophyticus]|uniref:IPT/TIG domain-containing protein n=1 Tax=Jatrophihabitans endophyticus TaxID=1206085 RepID=A0A1M5HP67_9ACTN|nr:IPT/TIG domain-containing protein [Jatrophihabitans endophyticus]SHG17622.1 IPT/TIG domain-containing protein [Jatrophihabitans endophyticus]
MYRPLHRAARPAARRAGVAATVLALAAGGLTAATVTAPSAGAATARGAAVSSAAKYAKAHGYIAGISVLDTKTGQLYSSGRHTSGFASESVIKVMIAARLIVQGRMHGSTSKRAHKMIAQSDDNIANSFYGSVGGDGLLNWTKKHWKVPSLGSGPIRSNWWGSNRITSDGLVRLYAKLKKDRRVSKWLLSAMHDHTVHGSDGFYQNFGLPQAAKRVAIKQGWGSDYSYSRGNASQNSTGFVNGDRYAVAILARGPASSYGSRLGNAITQMAKRVLPGGAFPSNAPVITTVSAKKGSTAGGTKVTIHGRDFSKVTAVAFGGTRARFSVTSTGTIAAVAPKHAAGKVKIWVRTKYGRTHTAPVFVYSSPATTATRRTTKATDPGTTRPATPSPTVPATTAPAGSSPASSTPATAGATSAPAGSSSASSASSASSTPATGSEPAGGTTTP